ncbi:DUF3846 domain-containing protein [Lentzea sp. NPDC051208]|uniref:DUF3846 domain-containing protein n=1 Tax=Lentzea sp. NPDC051208 TaxID=3154642 RepID=UPI00341494FA
MVQTIVVPADLSEPIRLDQLDKHDAGAFRRIVGGSLEAVQLTDPVASVYFNEEGKLQDLPVNHRLTMLLWMHNKLFRGVDAIVGDGLIVGPPDHEGDDQDAPAELIELLFDTAEYRVQARKVDSRSWHTTLNTVPRWTDAYRLALKLGLEWQNVFADVRVVPELPTELLDSWYKIGLATPPLHDAVDPAFTRDSFLGCFNLAELEERLGDCWWVLGTAFYYRDACFICMEEGGDDWLVIRHGVIAGRTPLWPPIKAGKFGEFVARLLAATKEQCLRMEY